MIKTTEPTWNELSPGERRAYLVKQLTTIEKAWPRLLNPPPTLRDARRTPPGSRIPTNSDALSLRVEICLDLAYWTHQLLDVHPEGRPHGLDILDVPGTIAHLKKEARWVSDSGWRYGSRMSQELRDHAQDARWIAWPKNTGTYLLGECVNTVGRNGEVVTCGKKVRAHPNHVGDIKCPGCGLTDTVDGWIKRLVGDTKPVTATQLVPLLHKRLGVVVKEATIRGWKFRGELLPIGMDPKGRPLYDRTHAYALVTRRNTQPRHTPR